MDNKKWEAFFDRLALAIQYIFTVFVRIILIVWIGFLGWFVLRAISSFPFLILIPITQMLFLAVSWSKDRMKAIEERKSR